jgi:hypothetical protein
MYELGAAGVLGSHDGPSMLDLETHFMTVDGTNDVREREDFDSRYAARYMHEQSHWTRFHGTAIGAALTAISQSFQLAIFDVFPMLDDEEKSTLMKGRRQGEAICSLHNPKGKHSDLFLNFRLSWLSARVGYSMLFDSRAVDQVDFVNQAQALGFALVDAHLSSYVLFDEIAKQPTAPLEEHAFWPRSIETRPDGRLTTHQLFECAAVIDEMRAASCYQDSYTEQVVQSAFEHLAKSSYGLPLRLFMHITESTCSILSVLTALQAVIDFALNPPLPPLATYDLLESIQDEELDPPNRFMFACSVMRDHLPRMIANLPTQDSRQLQEMLTKKLDWHNFYEQGGVLPTYGQRYLSERPLSRSIGRPLPDYSYPNVLGDIQARFWALRQYCPEIVINHGTTLDPEPSVLDDLLWKGIGEGWFRAPLHILLPSGNLAWSGKWPDIAVGTYLQNLAIRCLGVHTMCHSDRMSIDNWPVGNNNADFWARAVVDTSNYLKLPERCVLDIMPIL